MFSESLSDAQMYISISVTVDQQQIHAFWPMKVDGDNLGHALAFVKCNLLSLEMKER